ncbi:hypothetical protein ACM66B_003306 [Microbotryomycetes sp. NB124-2]
MPPDEAHADDSSPRAPGAEQHALSLTATTADKRLGPRTTLSRSRVAPPSVSVSTLTTRSSSTTRLAQLVGSNGSSDALDVAYHRPWLQRAHSHDRRDRHLRGDKTPPKLVAADRAHAQRGRDGRKAVAFELGSAEAHHSVASEDETQQEQARDGHDQSNRFGQSREDATTAWPTLDDIIDAQIHQPVTLLRPRNLDPLLRHGISDYSFVLERKQHRHSLVQTSATSSQGASVAGEQDTEPKPHPDRVSLGKGKFSEVLLVRKNSTEFALKHTPLHSHHPLIATRLLREPTILAQLLPHPSLVKVYETIRTPGHFYLVEENLRSSITLESFVTSFENRRVPPDQAWSILEQLASVVHSLHEPLRVCHRDIKPENILVKVDAAADATSSPTISLKLLDFGLATHFSASEAKLTTCCGSPAYHAPELWRGLREPSGTVKYWGPEVDIWCVGLTLLRCLTPNKYPLGIAHSSLKALGDKVIDSLLGVEDDLMRQTLAGFLHMDGVTRMEAFKAYCNTDAVKRRSSFSDSGFASDVEPATPGLFPTAKNAFGNVKKDFKSTTFIPAEPQFSLELPIVSSSDLPPGPPPLEVCPESETPVILSRASSRTRLATTSTPGSPTEATSRETTPESPAPDMTPDLCSPQTLYSTPTTPLTPYFDPFHSSLPPPVQIVLSNPADETIERATSFIKYALRCAGILYHVRAHGSHSANCSHSSLPPLAQHSESCVTYLECVLVLPPEQDQSKASNALKAALRPPMLRAHTVGSVARSSSTPPERNGAGGPATKATSNKEADVRATTFFMRISKGPYVAGSVQPEISSPQVDRNASRRSRKRDRAIERDIYINMSDERALATIKKALTIDQDTCRQPDAVATLQFEMDKRGRRGRDETSGKRHARSQSQNHDSAPASSRSMPASSARGPTRTSSAASTPFADGRGTAEGSASASAQGLAMAMGPPRVVQPRNETSAASTPGGTNNATKGFFDFVGDLGSRLGGLVTPGERPAREREAGHESRDKRDGNDRTQGIGIMGMAFV